MVGVGRDDGLAVELEHQPQHAVRAGVLRPHVDGHRFGAKFRHRLSLVHRPALDQLADHVQQRAVHFLDARASRRRHVHVDVGQPARRAAVAAGQRDRRSARAPAPPRSAAQHVRRVAARRDAERHVARRARALRPAARTRARTRSRSPTPSGCSCRSSAQSPATPAARVLKPPDQLGREVLRVRRAAAVAEHQHLAARARTPRPARPPPRSDVGLTAAPRRSCRRDRLARRSRPIAAAAVAHAARACRSASALAAIGLDVRAEFLLGHLQRLVRLHRHLRICTG